MENKIKGLFTTIFLLILIGVAIWGIKTEIDNYHNSPEYQLYQLEREEKEAEQKECEHNYVQVSKYSYWHGSYYHIQKCTKCGKELK